MRGEPKRSLLFLHVQKTAGSTLRGVLSNRFAARDCIELYSGSEPDANDLDRARYVTGHLDASFIERFRQPPFVIALLRDPIDRALSAYSYSRSFPSDFQPPAPPPGSDSRAIRRGRTFRRLARECSLGELIESEPEIAAEYLGNRQARALCGPSAPSGEERLDEAIGALERCDYVGIGERLDETADWVARRLGWQKFGALPRANITTAKLRCDQVPAKAMDALREITAVDRELYRHALRLFESRL
ncbi:MAG TPA: sulfotransferase family 2 domain-containing protein, partial [Solirubrobacterales bacterium]|nr:sulfotransferase family 2 domain-containing protein [Solirubrobacterales bacterium]